MTEKELLADLQLLFKSFKGKDNAGPVEDAAMERVITTLALDIHRASKAFVEIAEHLKAGKSLLK
jgi:hypothetical protein